MPIDLKQDEFFINAGGMDKWINTPEKIRQQNRDALLNSPERISPDAVEYAKGKIGTGTMIGKSMERNLMESAGAVGDVFGLKNRAGTPISQVAKNYYKEADKEIYKPYAHEDTIAGKTGYALKSMGLEAAGMLVDPITYATMPVGGGVYKAGSLLAKGIKANTVASGFAKGALIGAASAGAENVAYDAIKNQYTMGEQRDLVQSALLGAVGGGVIGGVVGGVMGRVAGRAERKLAESEQLQVAQAKADEEARVQVAQEQQLAHEQELKNQFMADRATGEDAINTQFAKEQYRADSQAGDEAFNEYIAKAKDDFRTNSKLGDEDFAKYEAQIQDKAEVEWVSAKAKQNEARLLEEQQAQPKQSVSGGTAGDMVRLQEARSRGEVPAYNKANLDEAIANPNKEINDIVKNISKMKEAGLPEKEIETYFKGTDGKVNPMYKQALEEHKIISKYEESLRKQPEQKEVIAKAANTPRAIHEELKSYPEYNNAIQQALEGKPKSTQPSMFDKIEQVKTANHGDVVHSEDAYNQAMVDAQKPSAREYTEPTLTKTNAKKLADGKPTPEALAQLRTDLEARTAGNTKYAEAEKQRLLSEHESARAFASTKEERIVASKEIAKLNGINPSTAKGQAELHSMSNSSELNSIKAVNGGNETLARDLKDSTDMIKPMNCLL